MYRVVANAHMTSWRELVSLHLQASRNELQVADRNSRHADSRNPSSLCHNGPFLQAAVISLHTLVESSPQCSESPGAVVCGASATRTIVPSFLKLWDGGEYGE